MTDTETRPDDLPGRAGLTGGVLTAIFVAVVLVGAVVAWVWRDSGVAEVGRPAPALAITTFDGEVFDLVQHFSEGGGPVLLNLWASWCEPCKEEFPALSEYAVRHPDVTVVGVAVRDQEDAARAFAEEMSPAFPVGWDRDRVVEEAYPSFGLPSTFLIDSRGVVVDIVLAQLTPERLDGLTFEG
jgi:thiol-disulfide isomerase/thioredoxin